ncbi:MAG: hypothetical protein COU11_02640 [Candidatus Harrisonbacteria bacterium CG10_big_fil_rev_8_21_14_0_10_49_15]|uniref:DUF4012 domain-containing protein n=1 Tax=Candidatus Harrisonbacteria bacterium CG10_big_fil_rev_8_21_14_0_10_49_15 TaxID=1974587 RepID=A0A2H0UL27_9BACT|nr:MAG: hypothetical protein COU11_02640 [Candidatus Harrisonbacteria bacterium CG10_big_fil_rev_8_21_14_0_10_49_15]
MSFHIHQKVKDIYHPRESSAPTTIRPIVESSELTPPENKPRHHHRGIFYGSLAIIILALGFYGFRAVFLEQYIQQSTARIYEQLTLASAALKELDVDSARSSLLAISGELKNAASTTNRYGVGQLSTVGGRFFKQFADIPDVFKELIGISDTAIDISDDISFLKQHGLQLVLSQQGEELLNRLLLFDEKLIALSGYVHQLKNRKEQLGPVAITELLALEDKLQSLDQAVQSLVTYLSAPYDRDLLVLFQNASEIRPGGGFIGSYAHIVLRQASLANITVIDIYEPDGQLDVQLIPPEPLQRITKDWEARDANWFFDYPTSARQVIDLLNSSKIYSEQNLSFDGAIAINVHVIEDIIDLIGPVELQEYDLTLDAENFLAEVQREVETGPDKARNEPKRILKVLTPILLDRLVNLNDTERSELRDRLATHINRRNIMTYINNPTLQAYIEESGLGGEVASLSETAPADYLAVVNANIAGQKTDIFIDQSINLQSKINSDGTLSNTATITRTHTGTGQTEWWYNATNKNYLQLYAPTGARAISASGQNPWPTTIKRDYTNYETDGDLAQIAATMSFLPASRLEQFTAHNKTVFAAWVNTPVGKTRTFSVDYDPATLVPIQQANTPYQFIFERQSGVLTSFSYSIEAPEGYVWQESGEQTFTYENDDPPGRLILDLTLVKDSQEDF